MRIARVFVAGWLCLAAITGTALSAGEPKTPPAKTVEELDKQLADLFKKAKAPGASIALIEDGRVVLAKGYGVADVAANTPVTTDTVFRAGSISKSIVGIAVMMLVEEGKLDLDAKLSDLAPEIKFTNKWEATDPVRLVHLLEHTTGFDDIRFSQYALQGHVPLRAAVEMYGPYESRWRPGMYMSYSNAPPVIAGYIVEKASGMSWADFTRTRIFEPLGMTSAHWDKAPEIAARIAKSYRGDGVTEEPYVDIVGKPAGSLNVTPSDLAKLALMLIARGTYNGVTLLKPESVARIERPGSTLASRSGLVEGYGFGNAAVVREKSIFHGHDGGIDGFVSTYVYEPEHRAGFVAMVNIPKREVSEAMDLAISYFENKWPAPKPPVEVKTTPAEIEALTGLYQPLTPRQAMLAPLLSVLQWLPVGADGGKLTFNQMSRKAVGARLFQKPDRVAPNVVFVDNEDGLVMLTPDGADMRVPVWDVAAKAGFGIVFALALATSVVFAVIWLPSWFLGRLGERGGVLIRLVPALAVLSLVGLAGVFFAALTVESLGSLETLGSPSLIAQTIYWLSYAFPAFGGLALIIAFIGGRGASGFVRGLALVNGVLALVAAAYLWQFGWIGLQTWA